MLDTFEQILDLYGQLLIRGIFISVLVIYLAKRFAGNRINTYLSFQIIRWIILVYAIGIIIGFVCSIIFKDKHEYTAAWASGYWWSQFIAGSIIPLTLLNKKLSRSALYLLIIGLLMNHGWLIESFVIHVPAIARGFKTGDYTLFLPNGHEVNTLTAGFALGLISLTIGIFADNDTKRKKILSKEPIVWTGDLADD